MKHSMTPALTRNFVGKAFQFTASPTARAFFKFCRHILHSVRPLLDKSHDACLPAISNHGDLDAACKPTQLYFLNLWCFAQPSAKV